MADKQAQRWTNETRQRQARMSKGLRGIWDRLTRQHTRVARQNETDAYEAYTRDKAQKEHHIQGQLQGRRSLQQGIKHIRSQPEADIQGIKEKLFSVMPHENSPELHRQFDKHSLHESHDGPERNNDYDLSM